MLERRTRSQNQFIEYLSAFLVTFSAFGALLILVDPVITFTTDAGTVIKLGGDGFAEQMKGAVIMLILISGFTAVVSYWIGMTNQGAKAQDSVNLIAQASAPATAAAVAASRSDPVAPTDVPAVPPTEGKS